MMTTAKGAGRSENGNVVLSEFEAEFSTVDQPGKWKDCFQSSMG